jgi:hypothetical protein
MEKENDRGRQGSGTQPPCRVSRDAKPIGKGQIIPAKIGTYYKVDCRKKVIFRT